MIYREFWVDFLEMAFARVPGGCRSTATPPRSTKGHNYEIGGDFEFRARRRAA
jgi:hypothetical protein